MLSNCLIFCCPLPLLPFCLLSFPSLGSFPMSWLFASGGQNIGVSASASALPVNIQGWFPLGLTDLILLSKGLFKSLLQHHNSKASILRHSAFLTVQLSHPYITTGKTKITARGPITSWQIDGETVAGSKVTANGDCSHAINRCLLPERKVMTT